MSNPFVHLRLHSEYSLKDSVVSIEEFFEKAHELNMPALGIADHNNLFATVKFFKEGLSRGIKPIIGVDVNVFQQDSSQVFLMTFLCKNLEGYRALSEILSKAYLENQTLGEPALLKEWLTPENCRHLIVLQNYQSELASLLTKKNETALLTYLDFLKQNFENSFYIEISRTGKKEEQQFETLVLPLAVQHQIPLVATNNVRFLSRDDFEAHEARVAIHDGNILADPKRPKHYTSQQYLRSAEEMQQLFSDLPSALTNTLEIAKRCNVVLTLGKNYLPNYPTGDLSTEDYLTQQSQLGLEKRLAKIQYAHDPEAYWQRLDIELKVINQMGFAGYFLIVADFIQWSKDNGIPVGPGRGSGAGSLVAFALGITDLDPLPYDLLFERFLNPERVSMPDFDVDFCMEGRDRVIDYVAQKYGRHAVSQIITYGSMAAKAVVRDVGRVLGHPYGFVDKIAKLIPFELGITLEKAIAQEAELKNRYEQEEEVKALLDLALKLEGLVRNAGKHAGGVVIAPSKLTDFTPLYCEANGENLVSQFDKDDVEAVGLVKFDFLGLRTLTIINWALQNIELKTREKIDITLIPLDDAGAYELLKSGNTTAIFQLESRGMKDLIKRLKPDCFEDIIALVALFRPGPLQSGMVDDFIQRKHGIAKIEYPHPSLEPILKPTYGIILYQEQVMQIAQVLALYTLGAADILRRAMGKKKPEEMAKQRAIFVEGAKNNGVDEKSAAYIFDLMEKFAGYGFNKSHSAAYALVSYQTAWLKLHYPAEFMAAVLSSDMDNTDKTVIFVNECQAMKIPLSAPNINQGQFKFTVDYSAEKPQILYGLGAIKGAGEAALDGVIQERNQNGPYLDLFNFCERNDLRKVNKRVLEALIKSGAFDCFNQNRATLWENLDKACQQAEQKLQAQLLGQGDLFGIHTPEPTLNNNNDHHYKLCLDWPQLQILQGEKETLGWYVSGHPISTYAEEIKHLTSASINQLFPQPDKTVTIAGQLVALKFLVTKRGDRMAIATIEDEFARLDGVLFSEELEKFRPVLIKDEIVLFEGIVDKDDFSGGLRMSVKTVTSLNQKRAARSKAIIIHATEQDINKLLQDGIKALLLQYPGDCPIKLSYQNEHGVVQCTFDSRWRVKPNDDLLNQLRNLVAPMEVRVDY